MLASIKTMKIELEGKLLKMIPENDREKKELNQLWNVIIDCVKDNKKLVPVGQYTPGIKEVATFPDHIEYLVEWPDQTATWIHEDNLSAAPNQDRPAAK